MPAFSFAPIDLTGAQPLISGGDRHVFQHPGDPHMLIKVLDREAREIYERKRRLRRWYRRFRRASEHRVFMDEITEYIAAASQAPSPMPLARILGVAETTQGLGMLVEKISDGQGGLAPTLTAVVREQGLTPALRAQLDALFDSLAAAHIIVNDVSGGNIVVGSNAQGRQGMYLVDGFGNKQAVPFYAMSKRLNARRLQRKYQELLDELQRHTGRVAGFAAGQGAVPAGTRAEATQSSGRPQRSTRQ